MSKRNADRQELDLVPIMNLVTILIPFLLFSATFVSLGAIDATLPAIIGEPLPDPPPSLDLSITIDEGGYVVATGLAEEPDPGWTIARTHPQPVPESWDTERLVEVLTELKDDHPDEDTVILVPGSHIPYEVLIHTMDATAGRLSDRPLFPAVVVAGGST